MAEAVAVYAAQPIQSLVPMLSSPGGPGEMSSSGKMLEAPRDIRRGNTGLTLCGQRVSRGQGQHSGRNPMWPYRERVPGPGCRDHAFSTAPRLSVLPALVLGNPGWAVQTASSPQAQGRAGASGSVEGSVFAVGLSKDPMGSSNLVLRQMGGGERDLLWLVPAQPCGSAVMAGKSHPC